jgi:protein O-GlcNAc transferase
MSVEAALGHLHSGDTATALRMLDAMSPCADGTIEAARGTVLLVAGRGEDAVQAFRAALAAGDNRPATLLNLALAQQSAGDMLAASTLMRRMAAAMPSWDEPRLRLAEALRASGDKAGAERAYQQVLELSPARIEALIGVGILLMQRGDGAAAQLPLLRACSEMVQQATSQPQLRAEAWDALGLALMQTSDFAAAEGAFMRARQMAPARLEFALHAADAARANGNVAASLAAAEMALDDDPLNPVLHVLRGMLLEHAGCRSDAVDALEAAVALTPDAPGPNAVLGGMLARSMRLREAERALRAALANDPGNPRCCNDLAAVLMRMHRPAEACELLTDLISRIPAPAPVLCNLANATASRGLQAEAVALAREAIAMAPHDMLPWRTLSGVLPYASETTITDLVDALRGCAAQLQRGTTPASVIDPRPHRRLRVGLLSGSLRCHPVGWLTIAAFEALDPATFELIAFALNAGTDPITRRFRSRMDGWHDIDALNDTIIAERIAAEKIDILIDLGGYGDNGRMTVCARRPAPVQIKWVGAQYHSSFIPEIDWMLTDRWQTPPALAHLYSERLLVLPDGYICYSPPPDAPDFAPLPALTNGYVTFGCFNNLAKITPVVIETWCRILRSVPIARMLLKTQQFSHPETRERVHAAFASHGVTQDRIMLQGPSQHRAFLGEYNKVDLVLDPFPYSGGLTTCEALWMGVPTITLPGEFFAARHSVSHLSNAGLADWVAADLESYVAQAIARASDLPRLAALRAGLRAHVAASPLCDAPRFGRNLGAALRQAWIAALQVSDPATIEERAA